MKLYYGKISPFVRKVMILVHELNLIDQIELVPSPVNPLEPMQSVIDINPLGKIPALETDSGERLMGSTLIAQHLASLKNDSRIYPQDENQWSALRYAVLADGILDAGNLVRIELMRESDKQWDTWREVQELKILNVLALLETEFNLLNIEAPTIGEISIVCALDWLSLRLDYLDWQNSYHGLAQWHARISCRPSFIDTAPPLPA
ncbi:MAG: glutathione S-transferase family protein [Opitutaceae bacterium]|nr:glutathione S-transferase family protein [Opitutaceae bacterium]